MRQQHKVPRTVPGLKNGKERFAVAGADNSADVQSHTGQEERFGWTYIKRNFAHSPLGSLCVAMALIIGFYHGWLKRAYPGAISVFAYDVPMMLGLFFACKSVTSKQSLFPKSRTAIALQFVLFICFFYLLIPTDAPWLVRLASLRGWTFAPLMFVVGYHVLRTPAQLRLFFGLVVVLCIAVTIYGMNQSQSDFANATIEDEGFRKTLDGSTYAKSGGGSGFRVFSTFVGPGMYAITCAFGIVISVSQFTDSKRIIAERVFWAAGALLSLYGIFISASRSPLVLVICGSAVIFWIRGFLVKIIPTIAAIVVVILAVAPSLEAVDLSRMAGIFSAEDVSGRLYIVIAPTIDVLLENPLGHGLGYGTHGIPVILFYLLARYKPIMIDGDLGHAAVDFGIIGTVAYTIMMVRGVLDSIFWTKRLKGTEGESVGITSAALFSVCLLNFIPGSPFLHVPTGAIVWYCVGGLNRIYDESLLGKGRSVVAGQKGNEPTLQLNPPMTGVKRILGQPSGRDLGMKGLPSAGRTKAGKTKAFLYD
jgi:hypothetical protein